MSWDSKEGIIKNKFDNDSDYFNCIMHFLNSSQKKTTSYKYVYFKSLLDNLFNVKSNLTLENEIVSESFSRIYWNVISKYDLPQMHYYKSGRYESSGIEKIVIDIIEETPYLKGLDFDSLNCGEKEKYIAESKIYSNQYVIGALYSDLCESIYGFDKKEKLIYFSEQSYAFLIKYKSALERLNYYSWIMWQERVLNEFSKSGENLATKLDNSNKRNSLEEFKKQIFLSNEEKCFYCGKKIKSSQCEMDHVVPWSFVKDDKLWNLVVSCKSCNASKNNRIPKRLLIEKLKNRNLELFGNTYENEIERVYQSAVYNGLLEWNNSDLNLKYYKKNYQEFINDTFNCDMSELYKFFVDKLINPRTILDLGFGSVRDSLYFKNKGYDVYSIDPTKVFCDNAKKLSLTNVYQLSAQEMEFENMFDGIWACASLLHIPNDELNDVFKKCAKSLKKNGIMYASFKLGEYEGERNDRFFNDMNKEKLLPLLNQTGLEIMEEKITFDVRPDKETNWYNVILKK